MNANGPLLTDEQLADLAKYTRPQQQPRQQQQQPQQQQEQQQQPRQQQEQPQKQQEQPQKQQEQQMQQERLQAAKDDNEDSSEEAEEDEDKEGKDHGKNDEDEDEDEDERPKHGPSRLKADARPKSVSVPIKRKRSDDDDDDDSDRSEDKRSRRRVARAPAPARKVLNRNDPKKGSKGSNKKPVRAGAGDSSYADYPATSPPKKKETKVSLKLAPDQPTREVLMNDLAKANKQLHSVTVAVSTAISALQQHDKAAIACRQAVQAVQALETC
jgi:hypothetical protein